MDLDDEELEATRRLHNRKEEIEVGEYVRTMNRKIIPDKCICGNNAKIIGYYIKGVANHKNFFVKCEKCKTRTRSRKIPYKAVEEWNKYRGDLFLQERKIR